jgi:hypothetical protein
MMALTSRLAAKHPAEKFTPDLEIDEGFDLSSYGLTAEFYISPAIQKDRLEC